MAPCAGLLFCCQLVRPHRWICPFLWRYSSPSKTSFRIVAMLASSNTPFLCSPREMMCLMMSNTEPGRKAEACHETHRPFFDLLSLWKSATHRKPPVRKWGDTFICSWLDWSTIGKVWQLRTAGVWPTIYLSSSFVVRRKPDLTKQIRLNKVGQNYLPPLSSFITSHSSSFTTKEV